MTDLYRGNRSVPEPHDWDSPRDQKVKEWVAAGHTQADASRKFGVANATVSQIVRGVKYRTVPLSEFKEYTK